MKFQYQILKNTRILLIIIIQIIFDHNSIIAQTYGKNGMVVSDNVVASEVGKEILKKEEMQ